MVKNRIKGEKMKFKNIKDLKYITADNSHIDLFATCEEYGEIPMTLNLVDTEDLHTFVDEYGNEFQLEEYCKNLEIAPYVEPEIVVVVPNSITMRQARLYLLNKESLDNVEMLVSTNKAWQIEWEYASEVQRTNQLIPALQESLGLTNAQVDTMFIEASKL